MLRAQRCETTRLGRDAQQVQQLARRDTVLYVTIEVLREVAILVQPVMPVAAGKLLDLLGVGADQRSFAALGAEHRLVSGTVLPAPSAIFPRYVEAEDGQDA